MELKRADVDFSATILKTFMVVNGADHPDGKASPSEVAQATVDVLRATVPDDLGWCRIFVGRSGCGRKQRRI